MYRTISAVNDALIAIDGGLLIVDSTRTSRTKAVGKFIQGISHGYLGLYFDRAFIVDEKLDLDTITVPTFRPYPEIITEAIKQLDRPRPRSGQLHAPGRFVAVRGHDSRPVHPAR
jgi:hypothetical protein